MKTNSTQLVSLADGVAPSVRAALPRALTSRRTPSLVTLRRSHSIGSAVIALPTPSTLAAVSARNASRVASLAPSLAHAWGAHLRTV